MLRKIIHIDMDAFYASVEQRDHPHYRDRPLVVGGGPHSRGVVAAASYEARRFGIHSAMPSRLAAKRCPQLIFAPLRFEVYRQVSEQIREIFHDYTDLVEPLSLDEAYLDVTDHPRGSAMAIAREIKQRIRQTTRLNASAGVSFNKFLAKMASDEDKPNGLFLITPDQAAAFIDQLPIETFHGIGPATAAKMHRYGIHSGADLRQWPEASLVERFGKVGSHYYRIAQGQDQRPVNPHRIRKSIGAENSFAQDLDSLGEMTQALAGITQRVTERLAKASQSGPAASGHTLTLKIKYANYQQVTRSRTFDQPLPIADIFERSQALLLEHLERDRPVRLLGITISNLSDSQQTATATAAAKFRQLQLAV